jgi:hypothetical protein
MTTKQERIDTEYKRIAPYFDMIQQNKKDVVNGLLYRAAFIRVQLEDYEEDLNNNGYVEQFTQSDKISAYERTRPAAQLYSTMLKTYQSIIRQLVDLLPQEKVKSAAEEIREWM